MQQRGYFEFTYASASVDECGEAAVSMEDLSLPIALDNGKKEAQGRFKGG
jgi:hypothetical protein